MNATEAIARLRDKLRVKHLALTTEETYVAWLARFIQAVRIMPAGLTSEQKIERFLTRLARSGSAASTQNQAFNALLFFYRHALGQPLAAIHALRARRPATLRDAPEPGEVAAVLDRVQDLHGYPTRLICHLLYGCGLRVSEPLNLRIKDVNFSASQLRLRGAKGGKDRIVAIPCALVIELQRQIRAARLVWEQDAARLPVVLPGRLALKYPQAVFAWKWAWVFPAHQPCRHPRTGRPVRWRIHEANVQRAIKAAAASLQLDLTPHQLRHAYATHVLRAGANVRDLQEALGHSHLDTTMGYLHPRAATITSPLDALTHACA